MSEDFFGLFEEKRNKRYNQSHSHLENDHHDGCQNENDYRYDRNRRHGSGQFDIHLLKSFVKRIFQNKLLMTGILMFAVVCVIGLIVLFILFFPVIMRLVTFVLNNGLKGVFDVIQPILNLFLQGSGK